jgi:diadenosine tetraphosphatase ApaH/serine/threonine PP2A family protein phosphatase
MSTLGRLRVAVLSDVHSNLPALEAVLVAVEESGIDQLWCLGDLVGYGADPDACTALVRQRSEVCLVGNHDLAVLGEIDASTFSEAAKAAVEWTQTVASEETVAFLRELGPALDHDGFGLFHASPRDPIWEYVLSIDQAEAGLDVQEQRIGLIGHSHVALFFTRPEGRPRPGYAHGAQAGDGALIDIEDGTWLINPGSVGQPRDGDPRAAWLELDTDDWTARYHRVPYDIAAAAAAILAAQLPVGLAERLAVGR